MRRGTNQPKLTRFLVEARLVSRASKDLPCWQHMLVHTRTRSVMVVQACSQYAAQYAPQLNS